MVSELSWIFQPASKEKRSNFMFEKYLVMLKVENGQVAWVSVWCRQYSIDFGHAFLTTKDSVRCDAVPLF